jgi:RNA polymerase sigma factor (sigma-70 family)
VKISEAIKQVMKEEGYGPTSFSVLLGINKTTVHKYLSERIIPPVKRLQQITKLLNRSLILTINNGTIGAKFVLREGVREITFDNRIEQCREPVMRYCLVHMHLSKSDAEDVTQETMLRGMLLHYTWRPEVAMTTWLIGIAKRIKDKRHDKLVLIENYIDTDRLNDEVENVFRKNVNLFAYVQGLNDKDRNYFRLYINGIDYKSIADEMNTSEQVVKNKIRNIKQIIRRRIESSKKTA